MALSLVVVVLKVAKWRGSVIGVPRSWLAADQVAAVVDALKGRLHLIRASSGPHQGLQKQVGGQWQAWVSKVGVGITKSCWTPRLKLSHAVWSLGAYGPGL
jgi:hypothetical protein